MGLIESAIGFVFQKQIAAAADERVIKTIQDYIQSIAITGGNYEDKEKVPDGEIFPKDGIKAAECVRVYQVIPSVFAVARKKASMCVTAKLCVKRRDTRTKEIIVDETSVLAKMLAKPNDDLTPSAFLYNIVIWRGISGVAYVAIDETPEGPKLMVLETPYVTKVPGKQGKCAGYIYRVNGVTKTFLSKHVCEIPDFNPGDFYFAISPINPVVKDLEAERNVKLSYVADARRGNLPGGVLESEKKYDDAEYIKVRSELVKRKPDSIPLLTLPQGMKFVPFTTTTASNQKTAEILNESFTSVALAFGMHPVLFDRSGQQKPDKLSDAIIATWNDTLIPELRHITESLTLKFGWLSGSNYYFDVDYRGVQPLHKANMEATRSFVAEYNGGKITPNQWRYGTGDEPLKANTGDPVLDDLILKYSNTPGPVWTVYSQLRLAEAAQAMAVGGSAGGGGGASPSLPLAGSEGGRDQSESGEAQMIDETGRRALPALLDEFKKRVTEMQRKTSAALDIIEAEFDEVEES